MENGDCRECKNFEACYVVAWHTDVVLTSIPRYFNAIRKRDLCVNNDKADWEKKKS